MRNSFKLILFVCFFVNIKAQENTDLFNYSNSLRYADYLYNSGEFMLALPEYKRVLFLYPGNTQANIRLHDSYIRLGKYAEGKKASDQFSPHYFRNDTLELLRFKLLLLNGSYNIFEKEILNSSLTAKDKDYLLMSKYVFQKNWGQANEYSTKMNNYPELYQLKNIAAKSAQLNYKSPGLSLAMSAIMPGSGKVYSGYWKDGLFSFLFVGITAWQSYRGFSQKGTKSYYGWIMGAVSFSFYTGNIYGAAKAANKKNHELDHLILDEYEKAFISTYSGF